MLRRLFKVFVLAPLALVIIGLAVANRTTVTVSFDPFSATAPALTLGVPLYALAFILLIAGVVIGGAAAWTRQHRWRRAARRFESENRALRSELEALRRRAGFGVRTTLPAPLDQTPQALMRPPAA
jgi:uncharacterized integral membrane protein